MFVKPRFVQFLTSVSVAAMFIATPVVGTFDAAGKLLIVSAIANAQEVNQPEPGPGPGDVTPPGGPSGPIGPAPEGPVVPVVPDVPVVPVLPVVPVMPDVQVASAPDVQSSFSDSRDKVPSSLPVNPPAVLSAAKVAMAEAKTLRCGGPCRIEVNAKGEIKVKLKYIVSGTETALFLDYVIIGTSVTSYAFNDTGQLYSQRVKTLDSREKAMDFLLQELSNLAEGLRA